MISAKKVKELALDLFKVGCCLIIKAPKRTNNMIYQYIIFFIKNKSMFFNNVKINYIYSILYHYHKKATFTLSPYSIKDDFWL